MADTIEDRVERLKADWQAGYFPAVIEAFQWCTLNDLPLPAWLADAVRPALLHSMRTAGAEGRGKTGGFLARARRREIDRTRWAAADFALVNRRLLPCWDYPPTSEGAFDYASQELRGTAAQGSAGAVKASYERVQRQRRRRSNSAN